MKLPLLHVIATDEVAEAPTFRATATELMEVGRDRVALHLRLRRTGGRSFHGLAERLGASAVDSGAWCVVNGRIDIALTADVQAVQLGWGELPVGAVRKVSGRRFAIGASVHSADEARARAGEGADFLVAGSVFSTATHPDRVPEGPALVTSCAESGVPIVGIGGIDASNAGRVMAAGASGVAVIRAVWQAADPAEAALRLIERVSRSGPSDEEEETRMLRVEVNGTSRETTEGRTVAGLLEDLGLDGRLVVVEINRQIIRRNEIEDVVLQDGDRVEVVHFVGGG